MRGQSFYHRGGALLALVAGLGCGVSVAWATQEDAADFRTAKPGIQRLLRSKKTEDRVQAMRDLAGYPTIDAVKLALQFGFKDDLPEVREATYDTLLRLNENDEVCKYLLDTLTRQARRNELSERSVPLLAALMSSKSKDTQAGVDEFLEKTIEKSRKGVLLITELADELGARGGEDSLELLARLSKTKTFENHFGVRRAVVWSLIRLDRLESVSELIRLLGEIKGEVRADIVKYLSTVTGQAFLDNAQAWASWWKDNGDGFTMPAPATRKAPASIASPGTPYYYGQPIYAQKIVFVLDTSGSMNGFRLQAAKRELTAVINNLRDDGQFAVVVFNSHVDVWQKKMVQATPVAKKAAIGFVNSQSANSNTASYDALEAAFNFEAEAIFFLSDGAPMGGKVSQPDQIVSLITQGNRARRETIYTFGMAVGLPGGPLELFLQALAEQNFGTYRRVDQ